MTSFVLPLLNTYIDMTRVLYDDDDMQEIQAVDRLETSGTTTTRSKSN